jgi:prepilin-type processing-associated H-X9-DG protein
VLAIVVLIAAVACDQVVVSPSGASGSAAPSPVSMEPGQSPPAPPTFSGPVSCGDDHAFSADLLFVDGHAELDPDAVSAALRSFLSGPDAIGMPSEGWVRVSERPGRVQFVSRTGDAFGWTVVGFFEKDGAWELDLAGECTPRPVVAAGVSTAAWWLDPEFPPPLATDTKIHALIVERACAGGRPPEGRIRDPMIFEEDDWIVVLVNVTSAPGAQDCPGNPAFPITIELPSPVGSRGLFDGSVVPARDATIPAT